MGSSIALFKTIFNKELLNSGSKDFLTDITSNHPYFSVAQFFLLQLTEKDSVGYEKQAAKTAAIFNNAYWLNFQLQKSKEESLLPIPEIAAPEKAPENENSTTIFEEQDIEMTSVQTANEPYTHTGSIDDESKEEPAPETLIEPLKLTSPLSISDTKEDTLNFEPLHITDYFASQGIRLSEEVKPVDKLGKQLKSFTEWLRTMKKVHPGQIPGADDQTNDSILQLAEKSNSEDEILTEAMAEVLLQQGKVGKAIEVYEKLSLFNPSKKAYFAAKIEQLKV